MLLKENLIFLKWTEILPPLSGQNFRRKVLFLWLGYNESKNFFKSHFESTKEREVYKVYNFFINFLIFPPG